MGETVVFVVEVRHDKAGMHALVRAASSVAAESFVSADGLWRFLAASTQPGLAPPQATSEQRPRS